MYVILVYDMGNRGLIQVDQTMLFDLVSDMETELGAKWSGYWWGRIDRKSGTGKAIHKSDVKALHLNGASLKGFGSHFVSTSGHQNMQTDRSFGETKKSAAKYFRGTTKGQSNANDTQASNQWPAAS